MTSVGCATAHSELAAHLARAAEGDTDAFMRFYDATIGCAFTLAISRARACGLPAVTARAWAEREVEARYTWAWSCCAEQPSSGLSPLAWVLALPTTSRNDEVACA